MLSTTRRRAQRDALDEALRTSRELAERHAEITRQISSLESFIFEAPARVAEQRLDRMQTIPPPEAFDGVPPLGAAEPTKVLRGQAALDRAGRRRNMFVFLLAAGAFAAFANWLSQAL